MQYLKAFRFASADDEDGFVLSYPPQLEMQCYSHTNVYPFKLFPQKELQRLDFAPLTLLYGGNGSGKSTVLNVIAQKLALERDAPFNNTPFMEDYLRFCHAEWCFSNRAPSGSRIITSDDVFDFLLQLRAINDGVELRRQELFSEYIRERKEPMRPLRSLSEFDAFRRQNEAKRKTKSAYVGKRMPKELDGHSNGESAFSYFTQRITENALFLLDEPENSLSAALQTELAGFLADSVRFYNCQFIISTHSPFLLSMKDAKIYDLDAAPVVPRDWSELENMQLYHRLFTERAVDFSRRNS